MRTKRSVALEFEPQAVKLVAIRQERGRVLVERAEQAATLEQLSGQPLGRAHCIAALPREEAFSRVLTLPSTDEAELRPMIELQAKSLLPYGQAEVVIDFLTLQRTATHTTILLLGIRRPAVEHYLSVLGQAGVPSPDVTLGACGLLQWYRAVRSSLALSGTVLLLEVDTAAVECLIITDDTLRLTRNIPFGSGWLEELDRTLQSYLKEHSGDAPTTVVLTGDAALVAQVQPPVQDWLHVPVRAAEPWMTVTALPGVNLPRSGAWSATLGLALTAGGPVAINFLPPEVRARRALRAFQRARLVTACLAVAVLAAATAWLQVDLRQQRHAAARATQDLRTVEPHAKRLAHEVDRVQRVRQALGQRGRPLVLLQELYRLTPARIALTQWVLEPDQAMSIRGLAPVFAEVLTYVASLEQSEAVRDVQLRYSAERATPQGTQIEFELVCRAEPSHD